MLTHHEGANHDAHDVAGTPLRAEESNSRSKIGLAGIGLKVASRRCSAQLIRPSNGRGEPTWTNSASFVNSQMLSRSLVGESIALCSTPVLV